MKRRTIRTTLVVMAIIIIVIAGYLIMNRSRDAAPPIQEFFLEGTVKNVVERNSEVDGVKIVYSITIENEQLNLTRTYSITDYTRVYRVMVNDTRESVEMHQVQIGEYVEIWGRFRTDHVVEATEVEIK